MCCAPNRSTRCGNAVAFFGGGAGHVAWPTRPSLHAHVLRVGVTTSDTLEDIVILELAFFCR